MREVINLTRYEYQKIFKRRSTWIALAVVFLWTLFSGIGGIFGDDYIEEIDETSFYEYRNMMLKNIYEKEELSDQEINFHKEENDSIETPYAYGNMIGYDNFFRLLTPNSIFLAFAVAIILAPMFAGEYTSNMDSLVLSSRFGKNKLIQAKLLTGISFGIFAAIAFTGLFLLEIQVVYGLSGWNLPAQVSTAGFYLTLPVNLLELAGIAAGCCAIAICMTAVFVMFCSVKMKSPFGVIIVSFAFIFAPIFLIYMVADHRILFMIVNSFPTSMMYVSSATAPQLISIGNHCFYFFQWVPVVYLCLIAVLFWWSYRSFKNHQVR